MKKLLLFFLFSGSLDGFSQVPDTTQPLSQFNWSLKRPGEQPFEVKPFTGQAVDNVLYLHDIGGPCHCSNCERKNTPDTLRAIVLVTLSPNGIAHSRMGFVVISEGKRPVYLDCNKKALKLPQVGWGYQVIDPNYKK